VPVCPAGGSDSLSDARVRATQNGSEVEIDTTGGGSYSTVVTLDNINAGDLTVDNWIF
jgi:hypothetical protein